MKQMDEFLETQPACEERFLTLFRKIAPYETKYEKPVHTFTANQFIAMFADLDWTRPHTFRSKRWMLCKYFDFLEANGTPTTKYQLVSLRDEDVPDVQRFSKYYQSFDQMDSLLNRVFFHDEAFSYYKVREMCCLLLSMIGLEVEQIIGLRRDQIHVDDCVIETDAMRFCDIPQPFMHRVAQAAQADCYLSNGKSYSLAEGEYVIRSTRQVSRVSGTTVRHLLYGGVNECRKLLSNETVSFVPRDLRISYLFCQLDRYEQSNPFPINRRVSFADEQWFNNTLRRWNGVGTDHDKATFLREYEGWRNFKNIS